MDAANFADKFDIADKMWSIHMKNAYLQFNDHKTNFDNNLQSWSINPCKTELGLIFKR